MKITLFSLVALLFFGCASPYQGQADALNAAYAAGQISANDYQLRLNELNALESQRKQNLANDWQTAAQNYANQSAADRQAQDAIHQQNLNNYYRQQEINNQKYQYQQQQQKSRQPQTYTITDEYGRKKTITVQPTSNGSY